MLKVFLALSPSLLWLLSPGTGKRTETDPNTWQYMTTTWTSKQPAFLQNIRILHTFYLPFHTFSNIFILSFYLQQHFHFLRTINMHIFGHETICLLVFLYEYRQSLFRLVFHCCFSYWRKTLITWAPK